MYQLAHRGYSARYPENTMLAFQKALERGFDGIETDVHLTLDGVLVLCHDDKINRTSTGKGYIRDYTYQELLRYNFNSKYRLHTPVATLNELLDLMQGTHKILNIEIKSHVREGIEAKVANAVKHYHMENQVVFSSTDLDKMVRMKRFMPESYCALIVSGNYRKNKVLPKLFHLDGIHVKQSHLNDKELNYFKENNIAVGAWTITREKDFQFFANHNILFAFTNEYMK